MVCIKDEEEEVHVVFIVLPKPQCISVPGQRMGKRRTVIIVKIFTINFRKSIAGWEITRGRVKVIANQMYKLLFLHISKAWRGLVE